MTKVLNLQRFVAKGQGAELMAQSCTSCDHNSCNTVVEGA